MQAESDSPIVVMITAGSRAEAESLAEMLVTRRLAACVQILPEVLSVYRWQGKVERSSEHLLLVKTTHPRFAELEREVKAAHSYDTPEVIAVPVIAASERYLEWLRINV